MTLTLIITIFTSGLLIASCLFLPKIKIGKVSLSTYWIAALLGAILLFATGRITFSEFFEGVSASGGMNPLKILTLFVSMTTLSVFLDEVGLFAYLANEALKKSGDSQIKLFATLFLAVGLLTVFTSNDVVVLTFTPFICQFCKRAKVNPLPYLFAEFVAANSFSMALIIGNPTNIYLGAFSELTFWEYLKAMILPTLASGAAEFLTLYLIFRKELKKPMQAEEEEVQIKSKGLLIMGIAHLSVCIVLLAISAYIHIEMWILTLCFAVSLFFCATLYALKKHKYFSVETDTLKRVPAEIVPFVLSMFAVVLSLEKCGVTAIIAEALSGGEEVFTYGITSYLASNVVNNIPMSVLFSSVLKSGGGTGAVYASIVGSNLGATLTPIGALAGIMWQNILKKNDVKMTFVTFLKYNIAPSVVSLLVTLGVLCLIV